MGEKNEKYRKLKNKINVYNVIDGHFHIINIIRVLIQCGLQKLKNLWFLKKLK